MENRHLLENKRILIVDDERDVLESLKELLPMCEVTEAGSFEEAKGLLETRAFDIAILDIMGVEGYTLLEIAVDKGIIPVMLTAHALSPDHVIRSFNGGAASYLPKEEMHRITVFLTDILEAKQKGKSTWWRWLDRLSHTLAEAFGPDWQKENREFWNKFKHYI